MNHILAGGRDYSPINQSLTFGPDLPSVQCVEIETFLDSILEFFELFEVHATVDGVDISGSPTIGLINSTDSKL